MHVCSSITNQKKSMRLAYMMPLCPWITMEAVVCATLCLDHELFMNDTMQHKVIHGYEPNYADCGVHLHADLYSCKRKIWNRLV